MKLYRVEATWVSYVLADTPAEARRVGAYDPPRNDEPLRVAATLATAESVCDDKWQHYNPWGVDVDNEMPALLWAKKQDKGEKL